MTIMTLPGDATARRGQLATNLGHVRERVTGACRAAGRSPEDVTLVVVTKFFPGADIAILRELGVSDIGENRDQEAAAKIASLPMAVRRSLHVHFVGQLQSNKAASVAVYADTVHSIDRQKVVRALDRAALAAGRQIGALVQVNLGTDSAGQGRGGMPPENVAEVAAGVAAAANLTLRGLMAVAPLGADPMEAFARLAALAGGLCADHPEATWISAGMSGDLEAAVANGATHLRVGSAILGSRPLLG